MDLLIYNLKAYFNQGRVLLAPLALVKKTQEGTWFSNSIECPHCHTDASAFTFTHNTAYTCTSCKVISIFTVWSGDYKDGYAASLSPIN